jgi:hypothetical protein
VGISEGVAQENDEYGIKIVRINRANMSNEHGYPLPYNKGKELEQAYAFHKDIYNRRGKYQPGSASNYYHKAKESLRFPGQNSPARGQYYANSMALSKLRHEANEEEIEQNRKGCVGRACNTIKRGFKYITGRSGGRKRTHRRKSRSRRTRSRR